MEELRLLARHEKVLRSFEVFTRVGNARKIETTGLQSSVFPSQQTKTAGIVLFDNTGSEPNPFVRPIIPKFRVIEATLFGAAHLRYVPTEQGYSVAIENGENAVYLSEERWRVMSEFVPSGTEEAFREVLDILPLNNFPIELCDLRKL